MNFELTAEQAMLRDTARALFSQHYDTESRNRLAATDLGWSPDVWGRLAELGLLGLSVAEEDGGMGAGPIEIMVVMREIGRSLSLEPLLDSVLLPGWLVSSLATQEQRQLILPRVAGGELFLAFANSEPGMRWPTSGVRTKATLNGSSWTLTGTKNPVPHGANAELLLVSAGLPDGGIGVFAVNVDQTNVERIGYATFDGRRAAQITLDGADAEPLGDVIDARDAIAEAVTRAQAALGAEAYGAMAEALRLTTTYLNVRKQFGVPLKAFQALTHRAADMYVSLEMAHSMMLYATVSLSEGNIDTRIASRAKYQIGRSAKHIGLEAIQMHGGIGLTYEYPVGHYATRLTAIEQTLGSSDDHLRVLASHVAEHGAVAV